MVEKSLTPKVTLPCMLVEAKKQLRCGTRPGWFYRKLSAEKDANSGVGLEGAGHQAGVAGEGGLQGALGG